MGDLFYDLKNTYTIEEEGYPTVTFENEDITIVSPDGVKVIIEENQVHVKFESFTESDENESLSALFTPEKCLIERNSSKEEEKLTSTFYYLHKNSLDEATCFHYKQQEAEITINNRGHFHGAATVGTNTEEKYFLPPKLAPSMIPKKRLTFQEFSVIELSENSLEEDDESTDEDEIVSHDYILGPENHKDCNVERRVFLLPLTAIEHNFKYGFELFEEDFVFQNFKNRRDVEKIGNNYVAMKPIRKISEFVVPIKFDVLDLSPELDCKQLDIADKLKTEWKDSFWTQKFVDFLLNLFIYIFDLLVAIFGLTKKL